MNPKQPVQPPFGALSTNGGQPSTNGGRPAGPFDTSDPSDPYSMPAKYWERAGQTSHEAYVSGEASDQGHGVNDPVYGSSPAHFRQEAAFVEMLTTLWRNHPEKKPKSIFEAGCGRGRLAHLFQRILPNAAYEGVDVGEAQLQEAMQLRPDGTFHLDDLTREGFARRSLDPLTHSLGLAKGYDLVVCAEVLMHIRPIDLLTAFDNLVELTKTGGNIVTIDWVPLPGQSKQGAYWNFPHDYGRLFQRATSGVVEATDVKLVDFRRTDNQMIFVLERLA